MNTCFFFELCYTHDIRSIGLPPIELLSAVHTEFNVHSSTEADGGISRLPFLALARLKS
jgi:hypothetical protein